eukprot:scaffold2418_cov175-Amphora_coffeaeformis.AAC.1
MEKDNSATQIELILVNVSSDNDDEPSCVAGLLDRLLSRVSCYESSDWCQHGRNDDSPFRCINDGIRNDVERFVRIHDKLLALAAILLKSRAFFQATDAAREANPSSILVRLPRTIHNKPYIPRKNKCKDHDDDEDDATLSISHHFPFVGAAQRKLREENSRLKIGLDIVVREPLNTRLYDTWDNYLQVFQDESDRSPIRLRGKVAVDGLTPQDELWDFYFGSLSPDMWSWFCVAVGPVGIASCSNVQVRWTTLERLIAES